jgi:hypothetical protein
MDAVAKQSQSSEVGDLREAQVYILLSAIPALTASLGLLKDTLTLIGGYAFANYMEPG